MPTTPEGFRREQARVARSMAGAVLVSTAALALPVLLRPFTMPDLPTPSAQMLHAAGLDALLVAWLGAAVANVARLRVLSAEDIGGCPRDGAVPGVGRSQHDFVGSAALSDVQKPDFEARGSFGIQVQPGWAQPGRCTTKHFSG